MNKNIEKAEVLKSRIAAANTAIGGEWAAPYKSDKCEHAIAELEDAVLDFKMLVFRTDPHSPLYDEVRKFPGDYNGRREYLLHSDFVGRLNYLLDKYIQYSSEE